MPSLPRFKRPEARVSPVPRLTQVLVMAAVSPLCLAAWLAQG
jgi:hypothetical protein